MKLKKTWPSKAFHLYMDENGQQYLDGKSEFEEIKEVPENIDHLEFRVRLLAAKDSIISNHQISTAMLADQFSDGKPTKQELSIAADVPYRQFLASLESWNLVDEDENLIQITEDAINDLPKWIYGQMFIATEKVNNPKN